MSEQKDFVVEATVNSNGQVMLPAEIQEILGCAAGQNIKFRVVNGKITVEKVLLEEQEEEELFVPSDEDLGLFCQYLDQCTIC